jgi:hypothetical protein
MMKFRMKTESGEEFEFEGDEQAFDMAGQFADRVFGTARTRQHVHGGDAGGQKRTSDPPAFHEPTTTNAIALRLNVSRGPDLFLAAATKLTLHDRKETFTRSEILREMSSATSFFNENHRKNLSKYVRKLIAERKLNERSKDLYALTMEARTEFARRLAMRLPALHGGGALRDSVLEYQDPFEPVANEDWEAVR